MKAGEDGVCVKYPSSVLATVPSVFYFSCQMYGKSGRAYIYKMCQSLFTIKPDLIFQKVRIMN